MNKLEQILNTIDSAATVLEIAFPDGTPADAAARLASAFARIAAAAVKAHDDLGDEPLDLSKLHEIDPVE